MKVNHRFIINASTLVSIIIAIQDNRHFQVFKCETSPVRRKESFVSRERTLDFGRGNRGVSETREFGR